MTKMRWDPTISLGAIIQAAVVLAAVAALYGRLVVLESRVDTLWARSETAIQSLRVDLERRLIPTLPRKPRLDE